MITYQEASRIAHIYFKEHTGFCGLSEAMETETEYLFCCGKTGTVNFGGVTIAVNKSTGNIKMLKFTSREVQY